MSTFSDEQILILKSFRAKLTGGKEDTRVPAPKSTSEPKRLVKQAEPYKAQLRSKEVRSPRGNWSQNEKSTRTNTSEGWTVGKREFMSPRNAPDAPRTVQLGDLAMSLNISIALLWEEARELGLPENSRPASILLTGAQADALRDFASHYRGLQQQPWKASDYVPRSDGKIRLSVYDLLEEEYRKQLLDKEYLPKRVDIAEYPGRNWVHVQRHVEHRIARKRRVAQTKPNADPEPSVAITVARLEKSPSMPLTLRREVSGGSLTGSQKSELTAKDDSTFRVALLPPKDPSVAAMRSKMAQRHSTRENNPEDANIDAVSQKLTSPPTAQTSIGSGSHAISLLIQTLKNFSPKDYAVLFDQFQNVVRLDRKIGASVARDQPHFSGTDEALRRVMNSVFAGKFGLFAYYDVGNAIAGRARRYERNLSTRLLISQTRKLMPMSTGLLTDLGRSRFIFWSIEKNISIGVVRFVDLQDWLEGMRSGSYQALVGEHFILKNGTDLTEAARSAAAFLAESASMLRDGYKVRQVQENSENQKNRSYPGQLAGRPSRVFTYKPHSSWLVPITIEGSSTSAGLKEDFFVQHGAKTAHAVRETMRRPAGSHPNAEKSILVRAHIRGGYDVGDIGFMPTVTILREKA